ncbi:MAG: T9SS type A sorting domain-containing protein [Bacteroidota bacterium]
MKRICAAIIFSLLVLGFVSSKAQCLSNPPQHFYYVTDSIDFTPGSLRQQILNANADGTGGIICIGAFGPVTIYLQAPLPVITADSLSIFDNSCLWMIFFIDGSNMAPDPLFSFAPNAPHSCFNRSNIVLQNFAPTTFYVTNTNDGGMGSLRDAIIKCNWSDSKDEIDFNILGIAPHQINLLTDLELINYSIKIDGTTQPANGYTGSAPKIELNGNHTVSAAIYFLNTSSISFDIYGLYIHNFNGGITSQNSSINSNIGSPSKPNVISGNNGAGILLVAGQNTSIANNYLGTDTSGSIAEPNSWAGIELHNCTNTLIKNNVIAANNIGIYIPASSQSIFSIQGNKIGVAKNGYSPLPNSLDGIHIGSTNSVGLIGGLTSTEANIIAFNNKAVYIEGRKISILKNSVFHNAYGIELYGLQANDTVLKPLITFSNHDTISGTSRPFSRIELFYNIDPLAHAQGKTFIASVIADSSGNWQYTASISNPCNITVTQTDTAGNTSEFSLLSGHDVHLINDTSFCLGNSILLDAGTGFDSYQWNTGDSTQTISVDSAGTYIVQTLSAGTHCPSSDTVTVTVNSLSVNLGDDTLVCNTQTIMLDAGIGFANYLWQDGSTTESFLAADSTGGSDTTLFFVTITDTNGCLTTDSIIIIFNECLGTSGMNNSHDMWISPNPFTDKFSFHPFNSSSENISIIVLNIFGEKLFEKQAALQDQEINLSFLQNGIYFLSIKSEKSFVTQKIIKL